SGSVQSDGTAGCAGSHAATGSNVGINNSSYASLCRCTVDCSSFGNGTGSSVVNGSTVISSAGCTNRNAVDHQVTYVQGIGRTGSRYTVGTGNTHVVCSQFADGNTDGF